MVRLCASCLGTGSPNSRQPGHHSDTRLKSHFTFYAFGQMPLSLTSVLKFKIETASTRHILRFCSKFVREEMIHKMFIINVH